MGQTKGWRLCDRLIEDGIDVVGIYKQSSSVSVAAEVIGISECTLSKWLRERGLARPEGRRTHRFVNKCKYT